MCTPLDGDIVWSLEILVYMYYQMDTIIVTLELTMNMSREYRRFVKNLRMLFC